MPHSNNLCYEFGPFRLNASQRVLTRDGDLISLAPKATEILLVLLRNAGELVGKEEMMKVVWPDSFVEEANLSQNIFTLRRALGDARSDARYIETVTGRGYRFVASVKTVDIPPLTSNIVGEFLNVDARFEAPPTLAVLPFMNGTGNDELEYLADGVSDNIINSLSQISKLRVMSRSAVFRFKGRELDPKFILAELGVDAVLLGKVISRPSGLMINAELVDVATGWQLWGESFDCESQSLLEIQDEIARQISATLRLKLTGDEEKRITTRYTESSSAYQAYIEGRFHWSRYTRAGIEKAIGHFRSAIELDPNYALAYAGIVDCYLRLATNYLPPEEYALVEDDLPASMTDRQERAEDGTSPDAYEFKIKLRHEWDWKGAERELRRANELKSDYPSAHQWHAAYLFVKHLYQKSQFYQRVGEASLASIPPEVLSARIPSGHLTPSEEVQVFCAIARDQIDVGNYEAARLVLKRWWSLGLWPKLIGLGSKSCADLLFTTGELAGFVASAEQLPIGQKNAENLLSGSIALFEQLGSIVRAAEGRTELALCYYRQGNFDLGRATFVSVLDTLPPDDCELRCLALIRLASLERHAGRPEDAFDRLTDAKSVVNASGPWASARHHLELASTYKDLAIADEKASLFDFSLAHYRESLNQFEAIGNLRMVGIAENNLAFLLVTLGRFDDAQFHSLRARSMFEGLRDKVRRAQVDDTLARLHLALHEFDLAEKAANRAIETLQSGDEDVLLAEVLSTKGIVCARLKHFGEAERMLERAHGVALRCGDREGAGRALLLMIEEIGSYLSSGSRKDIGVRLLQLLSETQQSSIRARVQRSLELIRTLSRNR